MKKYKKLKRRSKEVKALNQNLNETLDTITIEKDCLIKENQNLNLENEKLEESNINLIKKMTH